jgi:ferredoxin
MKLQGSSDQNFQISYIGAEAIVVGSGPAALSAIKVLLDNGIKPTVLDVGVDIDFKSESLTRQDQMGQSPGRKALFGSFFPYHQVKFSNVRYTQTEPSISFAKGGFSNVWGATSNSDFRNWPDEIVPSAQDVSLVERLLNSCLVGDGTGELNPGLLATQQANSIQRAFKGTRWKVRKAKLSINRVGPNSCIRCNLCIEGCPRSSIWNSSFEINRLIEEGLINYKDGKYVDKLVNHEGKDYLEVINIFGEIEYYTSELIFCGAGAISTSAILLRSGVGSKIEIKDSSTAYSAIVKPFKSNKNPEGIALSHTWLQDKKYNAKHQFYAPSKSNSEKIRARIPKFLRFESLITFLAKSIYPLISYLPEESSGKIIVEFDNVHIFVKSEVAERTKWEHRKASRALFFRLLRHGYVLIPFVTTVTTPGTGYHTGSLSILTESDIKLGSVDRFPSLSLIDASALYRIPVGSITPNVMINAARITRERITHRGRL